MNIIIEFRRLCLIGKGLKQVFLIPKQIKKNIDHKVPCVLMVPSVFLADFVEKRRKMNW